MERLPVCSSEQGSAERQLDRERAGSPVPGITCTVTRSPSGTLLSRPSSPPRQHKSSSPAHFLPLACLLPRFAVSVPSPFFPAVPVGTLRAGPQPCRLPLGSLPWSRLAVPILLWRDAVGAARTCCYSSPAVLLLHLRQPPLLPAAICLHSARRRRDYFCTEHLHL